MQSIQRELPMQTATQSRRKRSTTKSKRDRPRRPQRARKPLRMSTPEAQRSLIDEIDDRQETLLNDLAALNARVEALLNECLATREQQRLAEEGNADAPSTLSGPSVLISQSLAAAAVPQEC